MTHKEERIKHLNALRAENNMPTYNPAKLKMSVAEIDKLIYQLETPAEVRDAVAGIPLTDGALLAQLNVLRKRSAKKVLKRWQTGRDKLEHEIKQEQAHLEQRARDAALKGAPKIADGANTRKTHTDLHKNEMRDAVRKMDKKKKQDFLREQKASAKAIALWTGFKHKTVLDYLIVKETCRPTLAGDALKADISAWLKVRVKIAPKKKGRAPNPLKTFARDIAASHDLKERAVILWLEANKRGHDKPLNKTELAKLKKFIKDRPKVGGHGPRVSKGLSPASLASLMKKEPRDIRIKLRKIEAKIPKAWRIADERWGIKKEHQKDIIKLLGGD